MRLSIVMMVGLMLLPVAAADPKVMFTGGLELEHSRNRCYDVGALAVCECMIVCVSAVTDRVLP